MQSKADGMWHLLKEVSLERLGEGQWRLDQEKGFFLISIFNFMITIRNLEKETIHISKEKEMGQRHRTR